MRVTKILAMLGILLCTGCSLLETPEVVYKNLQVIRENVEIQSEITKMLLNDVVQPQNEQQVEAIALQRVVAEERYDYVAHAINRLILYLRVERHVDLLIYVADYTEASKVKELLEKAREQLR